MAPKAQPLVNYIAYVDAETGLPRIGHLDLATQTIQPLSFASGTPVRDLYQVIEAGADAAPQIVAAGEFGIPAASVQKLPPIAGRDVLAVGKNYADHAREFNSSGFDSSDTVAQPSHPVIFTKRATSIVADGDAILPHAQFTASADYEGEIGVIVGRAGFRIRAEDAMQHVWGYTIINDMTARERQRDHKQFFLGKSPDTFCPMGPIAVPKEHLPATLALTTTVNGELRQQATSDDLIFSIPTLLATISAGLTLQPGDVLATGTPAGVGLGKKPPVFLKPGDEIAVTISGLGTLRNTIADATATNDTVDRVKKVSAFDPITNGAKSINGRVRLTTINGKPLYYQRRGPPTVTSANDVVFVHGLGGTHDYWTPLVDTLGLAAASGVHLFDWEGHGLSPTHPLSALSVRSLAADAAGVLTAMAGATAARPATLVAHSLGCLAAVQCALDHPQLVGKLVLLGPPPSPVSAAAGAGAHAIAQAVRREGMAGQVDAAAGAETSARTKKENPLAVAAVRLSLLGQDPEAYAKACHVLGNSAAATLPVESLAMPVYIVTGDEDVVSPPAVCEAYAKRIPRAELVVLRGVGHWHVYEDLQGVATALKHVL